MADDAVGVAAMTLDGRVLAANPELTAFLDLGDLLAEPRPFTDFVHADDLPEALERYTRLLRGEPDTQRMDLRVVRPDGVILWVRIVARLVRTPDGAPSHIVIVLQDDPDRLWSPAGSVRERLARLPGASVTEDWLRRAFAGGITRVGICALDLDGFGALVDAPRRATSATGSSLAVAGRLRLAAGQHLAHPHRRRRVHRARRRPRGHRRRLPRRRPPASALARAVPRSTGWTWSSRRASAWPKAPPRTAARRSCCGPRTSPGRGPRPSAAAAG